MVVGYGFFGLFSIMFAKLNDAMPIIAVDFNKKCNLALKFGSDHAISPDDSEHNKCR